MDPLIVSKILLAAVMSYCVGSIPSGFLVAYASGIKDIRSHGSGNIGATNVSRSLGWWSFLLVFLLDAGKAYLTLYVINTFLPGVSAFLACAFCVLLGNCYSIFLEFEGGKGVATSIGLYAFLFPQLCLMIIALWIIAYMSIKRVGIASVIVSLCAIISSFWFSVSSLDLLFIISSSVLVVVRHYSNIIQYFHQ